jgi:hypothetical protein
MPRGRGAYERRNARTVWLVYTRAGTYRRITFGGQVPALAADELVYRVRLPHEVQAARSRHITRVTDIVAVGAHA